MPLNAAFVTIGQSPRPDITPGLLARIDGEINAIEYGALDGLSETQIAAMAPDPGEETLVTRLRDGREVIIGKRKTQARLQALLGDLDGQGFGAIVLLCTGYFPDLHSRTLLVEAQRIVDHMTHALAEGATKVGLMVPAEAQIAEFHEVAPPGVEVVGSYSSPYADQRFAEAGRELAECDVIVMHCMGYDDSHRATVREVSGKPVLLAQRMLAAGVAQLV
ncbi:MAG: AroM family protein [Alphaproteobacteria bacterium]|jgi:protein AroM